MHGKSYLDNYSYINYQRSNSNKPLINTLSLYYYWVHLHHQLIQVLGQLPGLGD